jgi:CBS domain-containing protein
MSSSVSELLSQNLTTPVHSISESSSVLDAIKDMSKYRIGCLSVTKEDETIGGIISEQDIFRRLAAVQEDLSQVSVCDVMTKEVIVCSPADDINTLRSIMKTHCIRQVPAVDHDGNLLGIISMEDINAHLITDEALEIKFLHDYVEGRVR